MKKRPIDANRLAEEIVSMNKAGYGTWSAKGLLNLLCRQPTLTRPNEPLTLDELREMAQRCEGIYICNIDGTPVLRDQKYCAAVLDFSRVFGSNGPRVHAIYGDNLTLGGDEYGKTWLAYRRPPEGEEDSGGN